ncbi:protein Star-like isoform X2 [Panulirus ornatus]
MILGAFGVVFLLQIAIRIFGPAKSACNKEVCLAKFLEGPPAFNNEAMASYLRATLFLPPAASEYHLSGHAGDDEGFNGVVQFVKEYFKNKRGGVFVDLGAGDGEYRSVTLELEKNLDWSGLLVEPNERLYKKLLKKGRKAQVTKACVSPFSYPAVLKLAHPKIKDESEEKEVEQLGKTMLLQLWDKDKNTLLEEFEAQCVPLENLVYAAGITNIDLLVLDMSGSDLDILLNTKLDQLPDFEMILINSNGVDISKDVTGYFLERNMIVKRMLGDSQNNATYILVKFDARKDL